MKWGGGGCTWNPVYCTYIPRHVYRGGEGAASRHKALADLKVLPAHPGDGAE